MIATNLKRDINHANEITQEEELDKLTLQAYSNFLWRIIIQLNFSSCFFYLQFHHP